MKISKKVYDFLYFIFPFINGLKKVITFPTFQVYDKFITLLSLIVGVGDQIASFGKKTPSSSFNYYMRMT